MHQPSQQILRFEPAFMYLNFRNVVWLTLLTSGAIATWFLGRPPQNDDSPGAASTGSTLGYYLNEAVLIGTDQSGEVLYRMAAERIEENPDTEQLLLWTVELEYRDDRDVPWRVRASAALGPKTREYFDFTGGVSIERDPDSEGLKGLIEAQSLRLEPDRHFASTEGPVRFLIGDTWLHGVGLKADLKGGEIDLESDVYAQIR